MIYNLFIDSSFNRFMLYLFENGKCIYLDGVYLNDKDVSILNIKFTGGSIIKREFISIITPIFNIKHIEDITPVKRDGYLHIVEKQKSR